MHFLSYSLHMSDTPSPYSSSWPFAELAWVSLSLSSLREHSAWHTTAAVSPQCWVERKDHFSWPSGCAGKEIVVFLCNILCHGQFVFFFFPDKLFSSMYWWLGLFLCWSRTFYFLLLDFMRFLLSDFPVLLSSLWMAVRSSEMLSNISPSSVSLANLLRVQPFLSSRLMMKILNNFVPSDNPLYYTPSDWPPTGQQITALWAKFFISFQSIRATSLPTSTKLVI